MHPTAYEFTLQNIAPGLPEARRLESKYGTGRVMSEYLATSGRVEGVLLREEVIAALPFALADRVSRTMANPYDWEGFAMDPDIIRFATSERSLGAAVYGASVSSDFSAASIQNLWQMACHAHAGRRVYELSPGLTDRLRRTELHGLSTNDLRLPYPSVYLTMPEHIDFKLYNQLTGDHDFAGVYVTETLAQGERAWKLLLWGPPNAQSANAYDDALFHFTVRLPENMDLETALAHTEAVANPAATRESEEYYRRVWRPIFALVMNAVVYLTWPDAELRESENPRFLKLTEQMKRHAKGSRTYERLREERKEVPQMRRVIMGPSVPRLEHVPASRGGLTVRTLVAGHWQRFAFGPGKTQRKWGWRQPFWRGPADAEESNPKKRLDTH